jgi:hypothetical protein
MSNKFKSGQTVYFLGGDLVGVRRVKIEKGEISCWMRPGVYEVETDNGEVKEVLEDQLKMNKDDPFFGELRKE